jgi:N-acetylmuramoyl-L-alanine amidase
VRRGAGPAGRGAGGAALGAAAIVLALAPAVFPSAGAAGSPGGQPLRFPGGGGGGLAADEAAVLRDGRELFLEIQASAVDTWVSVAQRTLADPRDLAVLKRVNGVASPASRPILVPYEILGDDQKVRILRDLWPGDGPRGGAWLHRAGAGRLRTADESLWLIALLLTGNGENFAALADLNDMPGLSPRQGDEIAVPASMLLAPFARLADPSAAAAAPAAGPGGDPRAVAAGGPEAGAGDAPAAAETPEDDFAEVPGEPEAAPAPETLPEPPPGQAPAAAEGAEFLTYAADADGRYARYRLKRGEALYSAVVVRFTGRVDAQEVNELAGAIARRSRVRDVTDIPTGFGIKIPLDLLLPEYLPRDDPRRLAWERSQAGVAAYTNPATTKNLEGVAVILDAGHGGADRGAAHNGVWEHDYVYDVLCRIKRRLEAETGARVLSTIRDRQEGFAVHDSTRLPRSRAEMLLTDPPYALASGKASVNLRWYLTNSYFRRLVAEGFDRHRIVFASLHADARHPSLQGAMVYVPGEEYRRGRYGHRGAVYARYREVREQTYVSFTAAELRRSEGLSRQLASALIGAFRDRGVRVHDYLPVRERIIRRGRSWVPAVLRCSQVPVQTLIEISNLSNAGDSRRLQSPAYRQQVADAYVDALQRYFEGPGGPGRPARPRPAAARAH